MVLPSPWLRPRIVRLPSRSLRGRSTRLVSSVAPPLIRIDKGTFYDRYPTPDDAEKEVNPPLFPDLSFTLPSGPTPETGTPQHWAVIGSAARTPLLNILRGQYVCLPPTARTYPYLQTDEIVKKDPRLQFVGNAVRYVGFSGEGSQASGGIRGAYLSARYESLREETDWTVRQYLRGQMSLNPLEGEEEGTVHDDGLLRRVVGDLRLDPLMDMPVANLSNGQTRRARIAKALLSRPELLLLDDPFMGLDPATVRSISGLLQHLADKADPRMILALRPQDPVPDWITHLMVVGHANQVLLQAPRSDAARMFQVWRQELTPGRKNTPSSAAAEDDPVAVAARKALEAGLVDRQTLWDLDLVAEEPIHVPLVASRGGEPLIEMDGVRVQYGDKAVLGDWKQPVQGEEKDGLHWTVRRGQRWAILGANGSGKTTLLSLITSDHPQAYALPIKVFGRSRLPEPGQPGLSLFELQSRLGHSSPEIHATFPRHLSIRAAIESAFAETILSKPRLDHDRDLDVSAVLRYFKGELDPHAAVTLGRKPPVIPPDYQHFPRIGNVRTTHYSPVDYDVEYADEVTFGELSTAQQRVVLFLRALIHKPDIVILDEAFSSMPSSLRDKCIHFLEVGELGRRRHSTVTRRSSRSEAWLQGVSLPEPAIRHHGLSDQQALVLISHTREEVPDCVRHFMRLPSTPADGTEVDFRVGILKSGSSLNQAQFWDVAWSPAAEFEQRTRRAHRRMDETAYPDEDERIYQWAIF